MTSLGRRGLVRAAGGLAIMLAACDRAAPPPRSSPSEPATPRSVVGVDAALGELRELRARLDRPAPAPPPTRGWDRLEQTEWPFFALVFFADAATRLGSILRGARREAAWDEARWALARAAALGVPGAARTGAIALLPDGHVFVALERFARTTQSDEHAAERRRLADGFDAAFDRSAHAILWSYPQTAWTLDAAPALAALALRGSTRAAVKWEAAVRARAIDPATGLARAGFDPANARAIGPPRGCALMLAMPDLAEAAPAFAAEQWALAKKHLVRTVSDLALTGVREWPEPIDWPSNVDSGRVVMGLGEAASGFGLAAAAAMGDDELLARFLRSARVVAPPSWSGDRLALRDVPPVGQAAMLRAKTWSTRALTL